MPQIGLDIFLEIADHGHSDSKHGVVKLHPGNPGLGPAEGNAIVEKSVGELALERERKWDRIINVLLTSAIIALAGAVVSTYSQMEARKEKVDTVLRDIDRLRDRLEDRTIDRFTKADAARDYSELKSLINEKTTDRIQRKEVETVYASLREDLQRAQRDIAELQASVAKQGAQISGLETTDALSKSITDLKIEITQHEHKQKD